MKKSDGTLKNGMDALWNADSIMYRRRCINLDIYIKTAAILIRNGISDDIICKSMPGITNEDIELARQKANTS